MIKRPKDINQLAKLLVDISTGQVVDEDAPPKVGIKKVMKPKKNLRTTPEPVNQDDKSSKPSKKKK